MCFFSSRSLCLPPWLQVFAVDIHPGMLPPAASGAYKLKLRSHPTTHCCLCTTTVVPCTVLLSRELLQKPPDLCHEASPLSLPSITFRCLLPLSLLFAVALLRCSSSCSRPHREGHPHGPRDGGRDRRDCGGGRQGLDAPGEPLAHRSPLLPRTRRGHREAARSGQGEAAHVAFPWSLHGPLHLGTFLRSFSGAFLSSCCLGCLLQGVTLGGTGKEAGDRHPKVQEGVLIGAGATILGNISVGRGSMVAAGSLVLKDVPPHRYVDVYCSLFIVHLLYSCDGCDGRARWQGQSGTSIAGATSSACCPHALLYLCSTVL